MSDHVTIYPIIHTLIGQLADAMWSRVVTDPTYDPVHAFLNPLEYHPSTALEKQAWNELTHPNIHEHLVAFVEQRKSLPISNYVKAIDHLLYIESERRFVESESSRSDDI